MLKKDYSSADECFPYGHISLKVPNVQLDFDVSVRHCLLSTHKLKTNLMLGTHLHALIRTHHFDLDIRFLAISTLMLKTLHRKFYLTLGTFSDLCL